MRTNFSASSTACIARTNSRAPAWAWPAPTASSPATADAFGLRRKKIAAPRFIFPCPEPGRDLGPYLDGEDPLPDGDHPGHPVVLRAGLRPERVPQTRGAAPSVP